MENVLLVPTEGLNRLEIKRERDDQLGIDIVELHDENLIRSWQDLQISTMPELISSLNTCHVLHAVARSPLLERLRKGPGRAETLLAGMSYRIGANLLRYMVIRGIVEEWDGRYGLTQKGEKLTSEIALARLGFYLEAYGPVLRRISDLLDGRATYGKDVQRCSGPLTQHSGTIFTRFYTPIVLSAMRTRDAERILDIGCGSGQLLIDVCLNDPDISGVGLDIAPAAIEVARKQARRFGLTKRLSFVVADAFAPETWPDVCFGVDLISGVGVLHEQLRDGIDAVIGILNTYAEVLIGERRLLIGEPEPYYDDRENDSDFFLVHVLSNQGLPIDRGAWLEIFERTRLACLRILTRATAGPRMCFYDLVRQ
jgi:SAM-dependent methyltransferase